jgi:hypothetical protein
MSKQSESILEENFLRQLELQEYERVVINDDIALEQNLKFQVVGTKRD